MKRPWFYAGLGAGILVTGLAIGLGGVYLLDAATHHDSPQASPDVLGTPVDIGPIATRTTAPMTPDDKMNAFLARSGATSPSDQAIFRDLAHTDCNTITDTPFAKLDVHAMLLHKFTGTDFKDDHAALVFLEEAIQDYCPEHADLIPK